MIVLVRPSLLRVTLAGALSLAAAFAGRLALAGGGPAPGVLPGLRIGGEPVPAVRGEEELRRWVEARAEQRIERRVVLVAADDPRRVLDLGTLADFGARVEVEAVVQRALRASEAEDAIEARARASLAARGGIDLPLSTTIDPELAKGRLARAKLAEDSPPVPARLDLDHHDVVPERAGRYLDLDGALLALARVADDPAAEPGVAVPVPVARVAPRFTQASLGGLDVHQVLAGYDTYFSRRGDQERRGKNIDVAASKLDGLVLEPGELFSFNAAVGDRSEENGFQRSWEINKGEMVEGVGGGTCQVASTFYAAAFFSGLEVTARLPHSRPSAYIPMGLDATVVYPDVDLKVRNPFEFPIAVHAKVEGSHLRVELLGAARPARVTFTREIVGTLPYERKVEEDDRLSGDTVRVRQHGIDGFQIKRTRTLLLADGKMKKEETKDRYPPTAEIDEVAPGFDESRLPPLPEAPDPPAPERDAATAARAGGAEARVAPPAAALSDLVFVEAPGAHAPTEAQANPPRMFTLRR